MPPSDRQAPALAAKILHRLQRRICLSPVMTQSMFRSLFRTLFRVVLLPR